MRRNFLRFWANFTRLPNHFKPKEILIPGSADEILAEQLLNAKVFQPKRAKKRSCSLANKNAKLALKEKFSLIERDEERTIHAIR